MTESVEGYYYSYIYKGIVLTLGSVRQIFTEYKSIVCATGRMYGRYESITYSVDLFSIGRIEHKKIYYLTHVLY